MTTTALPARERKKALRKEISSARAALRRLEREYQRLTTQKEPREFDPHAQAGPANVELMREVFKRRKLTAAEATRIAGYPAGHQVWAIRALVAEGQIEETGRKIGLSKEYRWVPSTRRKTRLEPGE